MGDVLGQAKADAHPVARLDEGGHRPRIKGVLPVDEFRMQNDVSLLRAMQSHEIRQPLPFHEVLAPDDSGASDGGAHVFGTIVVGFRAEDAVDIAIFM